jgi:hypothetical protein
MAVTVEIPTDLEAIISRNVGGDLNAYAREALAVQMYKDGNLTHGQLQSLLSVSSYQADVILKRHGGGDELTADELSEQVSASQAARKQPPIE